MTTNEERLADMEARAAALTNLFVTEHETLVQTRAIAETMFGIIKSIDEKQSLQSAQLREIGLSVDQHTAQLNFLQSQNAAILSQLAWVIELLKGKPQQ